MTKRTRGECTIDGCTKVVRGRTWCSMHYERWRLYGTTDSPRPTAIERLLAKVVKQDDGCWIWQGATLKGYGRFCLGGRGNTGYAHRASFELHGGTIPPGYDIDHLCNLPACVNPAHLEPVTHEENMRRMHERQAA